MKICITSQGDNLESLVDPRFGRCNYFIIYDTDNDSFESFPNPNISSPQGAGITSSQFIVDKGVEFVLTGNVGPNAFSVFQQAQVKVITGLAGLRVKEAIEKFKKGEFASSPSPNVSGHFGMGFGFPQANFAFFGRGMGRGMGGGMGRGMGGFMSPPQPQAFSKEEELNFLKQQLNFLKQQIEMIEKRIKEIEK